MIKYIYYLLIRFYDYILFLYCTPLPTGSKSAMAAPFDASTPLATLQSAKRKGASPSWFSRSPIVGFGQSWRRAQVPRPCWNERAAEAPLDAAFALEVPNAAWGGLGNPSTPHVCRSSGAGNCPCRGRPEPPMASGGGHGPA